MITEGVDFDLLDQCHNNFCTILGNNISAIWTNTCIKTFMLNIKVFKLFIIELIYF